MDGSILRLHGCEYEKQSRERTMYISIEASRIIPISSSCPLSAHFAWFNMCRLFLLSIIIARLSTLERLTKSMLGLQILKKPGIIVRHPITGGEVGEILSYDNKGRSRAVRRATA